MSQSKLASLSEAGINILIGGLVSLASQLIIFPAYDIQVDMSTNVQIWLWFVLVSFIRRYTVRRYYNWRGGR